MALQLERRAQPDRTNVIGPAMISPNVDEDYWEYRVKLTEHQAVLGFPKYGIIGIGFAQEENWNTNLPSSVVSERILDHIWDNAGDKAITRDQVREAIELIQTAVRQDREVSNQPGKRRK